VAAVVALVTEGHQAVARAAVAPVAVVVELTIWALEVVEAGGKRE
jgi:hypothetical protein